MKCSEEGAKRAISTPAPTMEAGSVMHRSSGDAGIWWARQDSNLQPRDYESPALTIVLQAPAAIEQ
jgi:hypothetical protein